jgi:hypothetical protein
VQLAGKFISPPRDAILEGAAMGAFIKKNPWILLVAVFAILIVVGISVS